MARMLQSPVEGARASENRVGVGVAARLSRYLQVLTQAQKMGKDRISSRKILRTQGQHNIALVGAGRLGQAIAGSPIFGEHGITIAAVFDTDAQKIGTPIGSVVVTDYGRLRDVTRDKNIVVGVLAVPAEAAQEAADDLVDAGVRIIFNYSEALLDVPADVTVHTSNPAVELLHALYFHLT
jgi:redox-sensing transcriptional repressor